MTRGRARVHLAAPTRIHPDSGRGLCGWLMVEVSDDAGEVTCKACLAAVADQRSGPKGSRRKSRTIKGDVAKELADALRTMPTLAPTAPPPPRLTAQLWIASCRGGEHRRCGECELCAWEREAQLWSAVSPWNKVHRLQRPESAPRWPSLNAALIAFAEWERHDRVAPSALGGQLDQLERGAVSDGGGRGRREDPLMRRAGEFVRVRQALDLAFPDNAHALDAGRLKGILMLRTPGMVDKPPPYEALSHKYGVSVGELQALMRNGRRIVAEELASRGLIPPPASSRRAIRVPSSAMRLEEGPGDDSH